MPASLKNFALMVLVLGCLTVASWADEKQAEPEKEKPKSAEPVKEKPKPVDVVRKGIDFLVTDQNSTGSWGLHDMKGKKKTSGQQESMVKVIPAITALGVMALEANAETVAEGERDKVKKAVGKGKEFFSKAEIQTGLVTRYEQQPRNWDNLLRTMYYARLPKDKATKDDKEQMKALLAALESSQEKEGGWTYLANQGPNSQKSTTFLTAPVLMTLLEAKHKGYEVPDKLIADGVGFMKKLRNADGTFKYYHHSRDNDAKHSMGSSARNAASELALFLAGESDQKKLQWTVTNFFHNRHEQARVYTTLPNAQERQRLIHWGEGSIATYYFMYAHLFVSEALRHIDKDAKISVDPKDENVTKSPAECLQIIQEMVRPLQSEDGSWSSATGREPNHFRDDHYNTGLALLILADQKLFSCPPLKTPIKVEKKEPEKRQDQPGKER